MASHDLRRRFADGELVVAPGVYDMISALTADRMGFPALYMTGYGTVASLLGLPDAGYASYTDMVGRVAAIAGGTRTPLIADADTGFGGLLNVEHAVRGYERAGAAGIQIEDQEFPKKCGHTPGRRVIAAEDMARKVRVAAEARSDPDFLIVARTDARTGLGLDEALRRAELYAEAGADVLFVESPESVEELERIGRALAGRPLLVNLVEGGRTPTLSQAELKALGFAMAIYPGSAFLAAAAAIRSVYATIAADGSTRDAEVPLLPFEEMNRLVGFERVWEFDRRNAEV